MGFENNLIFGIFLIFAGAAVLSTFALMTRQSMLVAYMLLGVLLGPWGLGMFQSLNAVHGVGDVGIIFLLFLLGLHLPPQKLYQMLRKVSWVGFVSSVIFALVGYLIAKFVANLTELESILVGASMMFSSTIIGIKLLPTTMLHHQHTGEVMISVLLLQDIIAIAVLLLMHGGTGTGVVWRDMALVMFGLPAVLLFSFLVERFLLMRLFRHFNRIKEYMFLVAIAWCLSMAELATLMGLSAEIGAFIAGVSLASNPISIYIAENLKPVRDFFLVMFFFAVGASFNLTYLPIVIVPALLAVMLLLVIKPYTYKYLLQWVGESKHVSWEVGVRLAQVSEFSLIIAYTALECGLIGEVAAYLIEAITIISFIISSYWVVIRFPTPMAMSDRLRRD